jgi:sulfotransferase
MTKKFYFMAGLPRSGSTLLSALLNQNPAFYSGPASPVLATMNAIEGVFRIDPLFIGFPKIKEGNLIISSVINQFYSDISQPVVIDKNRAWPEYIRFIEGYMKIPAKIICPVRDISEVLASFIGMVHRNPYKEGNGRLNIVDEQLVKNNIPITDDNRCDFLASPLGILGQSIRAMQDAMAQGLGDRLLLVDYKDLMVSTKQTLGKIYEFLGEPRFEHDFQNIENKYRENDFETYGLKDMHEVRQKLGRISGRPSDVLSPYVLGRCGAMNLWQSH